MRIDREDKIDGVCVVDIRNVLRKMIHLRFERSDVESLFTASLQKYSVDTCKLIDSLIRVGYLEIIGGKYHLSQTGRRLCSARALTPLTKGKVCQILEDFLKRIYEVKKSTEFIYEVKRVILFGSCINPTAEDFGDIDLAYELEPKEQYQADLDRLIEIQISEAIEGGRVFRDVVEEACYPQDKVLLYLKNRNRYISLHTVDEVKTLGCAYKEIYRKGYDLHS